jgi:hypothetical protein
MKEAPGATPKSEASTAARTEAPAPAAPAQAPVATLPAQAPVARPVEATPSAAEAFPAERRNKASVPSAAGPKPTTESNDAGDSAIGGAGTAATATPAATPAVPAAAPAARPAAPAVPAAAGKLAPTRQQAMQRSPEAWLDEISRLKREGREKEAAEKLAEFRKAYPAYAVPESLRDLQ